MNKGKEWAYKKNKMNCELMLTDDIEEAIY
jgi:hypothetical protein